MAITKYVEFFLKRREGDFQIPLATTSLWNVSQLDSVQVDLPDEIARRLRATVRGWRDGTTHRSSQ